MPCSLELQGVWITDIGGFKSLSDHLPGARADLLLVTGLVPAQDSCKAADCRTQVAWV